jgi:hypothetical protein
MIFGTFLPALAIGITFFFFADIVNRKIGILEIENFTNDSILNASDESQE